MRWLYFLSRLAFICNIFFVLAVVVQMTNWIRQPDITSAIAFLGYLLVFLINPLVNFFYFILFVLRKKFWQIIPSWLITANIMFLVIQLLYILYLNDTKHT